MHSIRNGAESIPSASAEFVERGRPGSEIAGPLEPVPGQCLAWRCGRPSRRAPSCRRAAGCAATPSTRAGRPATRPPARARRAGPGPGSPAGPRSRRHRRRRPPVVLQQKVLDQRSQPDLPSSAAPAVASVSASTSTIQPRWPRTRPPRTGNSCTEACSSSPTMPTTSASVPSPSTTACFSIARRTADRSSRSRAARSKSRSLRRDGHLALQAADQRVGPAGHEVAEVVDDHPVLLGGDPPDARRRTLADVAEQARPVDLLRSTEDAGAAGAGREHPQQGVQGLADRPGVGVRAEVAHALAVRPPHHLQPRKFLADRHREFRVRLVVPVPDVEPRIELLDPVVFQLERLDLGGHHRPLHPPGAGHHLRGARVQPGHVGEVGVQPRAEALGLPDVDDRAGRVPEPVHPRRVGDAPRRRAVRRWIWHTTRVVEWQDTPPSRAGTGALARGRPRRRRSR